MRKEIILVMDPDQIEILKNLYPDFHNEIVEKTKRNLKQLDLKREKKKREGASKNQNVYQQLCFSNSNEKNQRTKALYNQYAERK